jgi:hypothetical protein
MLVCNLVVNYTLMQPSGAVRRIEAIKPARNPKYSRTLETRTKWQLAHMGVDELRRKVLDAERKGKDEKEWLIGILLSKGVWLEAEEWKKVGREMVKRERNMQSTSVGMKRSAVVVEDEPNKRARTRM